MTLGELIAAYTTDPDSPYHGVKASTQRDYGDGIKALRSVANVTTRLRDLGGRDFLAWNRALMEPGTVRKAHGAMRVLRIIVGFGVIVEIGHCARLSLILSKLRFPAPEQRRQALTFEQVDQFVTTALKLGHVSMAFAQALQFECGLRQIDVIGEWVPRDPGEQGGIYHLGKRWQTGLTWPMLTGLILTKETSKTGAAGEWNLELCPLVMKVLTSVSAADGMVENRKSGPMIVQESNGRPYTPGTYRETWRTIARTAGIPDDVFNMDSRAGAITEGSDAGATKDDLQRLATHARATTTDRYIRKNRAPSERVARARVAGRAQSSA